MASTFTDLGLEIMATGENAGTWGDKTNTNLNIVNTAIAGYVEQSIAGGADTTTLTITDGAATSVAQNAVIKLTGSITGNQVVTIPDSIEKVYIITNGTSGAFTVQVKTVSGTGVTFGVSEKTTKLFYSDGTNIVDAGFSGGTDLDGKELVLDADGDTSITADTDDQIDIKIAGTDQITIKDGALSPVTNNDIDLGTASLEFKNAFFDGTVTSDAFAGPLTGNVTGNVSGTAATVTTAAQSNITSLGTLTTLTVDNVIINGSTIGHTSDTDLITVASGIATVAGEVSMTTLDIGGTNITATAAEINLIDGGATVGTTAIADGDGLIINDGGTMRVSTVQTLSAYLDDEITAMPNLVTTAATTVGALDSGSITSGFGTIDTGASTITTTGLISGGSLDIDNVLINGTTIGHTDDTDLITLADGLATVAGEISVTTLDIGGTNFTTTAAEINLIDGGTARGTTAVADADGILHNDGGTMRMTSAATFKTYFTAGVSSAADDLTAGDAAVNLTTSSGNITIDAAANDSDIIFKGTDATTDITMLTLDGSDAGSASFNDKVTIGDGKLVLNSTAVTSTAAELNLLDGVSGLVQADLTKLAAVDSTAAELNIVDGGTSATSTTVADADRVVLNDNGTMVQVAVTDLSAYFDDEITAMPNLVSTGALDTGSITSNFGTINNGASTITTTGLISGGSLDIDNVLINGTTIGHTDDTDLLTVADGLLTVAGEVQMTTLDIGGTNVTSTAAELNLLDGVSGLVQADLTKLAAVDSTAAELNIVDGGTSATSTTVADADRVVLNDAGTMVQVAMTDIKTYIGGGTSWQAVKTGNFTAAAGQGIFCNTTSTAFTLTLPAGSIGDEISFLDYAGTFDTNNLTIAANGSEKIHGSTDNLTVSVERAANTLVFTDGTQGWLLKSK
jgi:hypothetical protein